jgi:HlyD family secretion protein
MKKTLVTLIIVAAVAVTAGAYFLRHGETGVAVNTAAVSRGPIVRTINASGSLEAVRTVQIGSQVSGTIEALYADFNQVVSKGQLIARLDRSTLESQLAQSEASLARARADLERIVVSAEEARATLASVDLLAGKQLIAAAELDVARATVRTVEAQAKSAAAQVTQAEATVEQSRLNLARTEIVSPINGIVIARSVDVGQTVAASLSAPTIFEIAADL